MVGQQSKAARKVLDSLQPLPLNDAHWHAVFEAMRLSPRQAEITKLVLQGATTRQIEIVVGIKGPTIKEQLNRIAVRTGTRGRMQLAMHVLCVSHEVRSQNMT
jgi:DNA-binding CsgD family transcriptional regulator